MRAIYHLPFQSLLLSQKDNFSWGWIYHTFKSLQNNLGLSKLNNLYLLFFFTYLVLIDNKIIEYSTRHPNLIIIPKKQIRLNLTLLSCKCFRRTLVAALSSLSRQCVVWKGRYTLQVWSYYHSRCQRKWFLLAHRCTSEVLQNLPIEK